MPVSLDSLVKLAPIPGVIIRDPASGKPAVAPIRSDAVVDASGRSVDQMLSAEASARDAAIATAVNLLKDNGDGSSLAADSDSLKKLADALALLKGSVDTFLSGEPDAGTIDRLSELVAAISANKDTIDGLLTDKVDKTAIYDGLDSTDATKVLSAAQGKALKDLIDGIQASVEGVHTHTNKTDVLDKLSAVDGKLKFNGGNVGETRSWVGKVTNVPTEWPASVHPEGVLFLISASPAA